MVQKRSLFILCAVLVLALLVGCSRKSAETVEPTPTAVATLAAAATTSVDAQAENAATEAPQEQATVDPTEAPQEQETIETTNPVQSVTAITEVFGDGQKITAVALEYDADIDNSLLSESAFSVEDRTITDVYANTSPELATQGINGKYVIIQLSADDEAASVGGNNMGGGNGPEMGNDTGTPPDAESEGTETITDTQTMVSEQMPEVQPATSDTTAEITVTVTQTGDVVTVDGVTVAPSREALVSDGIINLIVDDFQQFEFTDPDTGVTLRYNLYIPEGYDENESYPLILFMHDAGEVGGDATETLTQGLGAVIWASPEEQAKHPSFVLAPQYHTVIANDESETTPETDATVNLIKYLETQYNIDADRLYTTGQSMGCMTSIDLLSRYPDLFAAAMLVAGQWDPSLVAPMANDKLWIIVSEGDTKAYPGMDAITAALEEEGATISRATWDPESTPEEFDADVEAMLAEGANINYTVLEGGNHNYTWQIAYTIEGIRDWLFAQSKATAEEPVAEAPADEVSATDVIAHGTNAIDSLAFDNSAWNYDADNDVYWQIGVQYSTTPATLDYETMGVYVPGAYMTGTDNGDGTFTVTLNAEAAINGHSATTAPIVIPVNTPGYSAHAAPTAYDYDSGNLIYSGGAPWGVTDLKAAIRYYRYYSEILPGDTDRIFTFGMSGGGAQSALMGASGDSDLYTPYLESIGAAMVDASGEPISDAVYGTMAWCPITSLHYADEAYEWNMGQYATTGTRADNAWTSTLSDGLSLAFGDYINALGITDENGNVLMLEESADGIYAAGSYYDYLVSVVEQSLNNFLVDSTFPYTVSSGGFGGGGPIGGPGGERPEGEMPEGAPGGEMPEGGAPGGDTSSSEVVTTTYATAQDYVDSLNADTEWVTYDAATNTATITSLADFVTNEKPATKSVPAFDDLDRAQAENQVFGNDEYDALHFDATVAGLLTYNQDAYASFADWDPTYVEAYATDPEALDTLGNGIPYRMNMYNPMYYLLDYYDGYQTSNMAKHWRINTGLDQGDRASTVEVNLALALDNYDGVEDVAFTTVWGLGHAEAERTGSSTDNFIAWVNQVVGE